MNAHSEKLELVKLIMNIENDEFISKISAFVKQESEDFWDELSPSDKEEIKKGIEQLESGKKIDFDEFMKKIT